MVRAVLHTVDPNVPVVLVSASRGKAVRAEPVSALYGYERDGVWHKDQIRHAGEFRELEDQMLNFSTAGYLGDRSPDRADALVWALTDLLVEPMPSEGQVVDQSRPWPCLWRWSAIACSTAIGAAALQRDYVIHDVARPSVRGSRSAS